MDNKVLIGIFGAITGSCGILWKYISGMKKTVQFKDVCKATHDGLNETLDAKFDGMKQLMEHRFDNLEALVKNNGCKHE